LHFERIEPTTELDPFDETKVQLKLTLSLLYIFG